MPAYPIDSSDLKPIGNTGEKVSAIGVGTWAIRDYKRAEESYLRAFELGINVIDTAEMYGEGEAERFVGSLIKSLGRDSVFVVTKLYPHRFRSRDSAIAAARASLKRMGISFADLILIHWPDTVASVEEQVRSLEALVSEGLARYVGVSNFSLSEMRAALQATKRHEIAVNQVKYSVLDRRIEGGTLDLAIERGVTIQAYRPLEMGRVSSVSLLARIGRNYWKTPVQVALNFLISRPRVMAISKAERKHHVEEIAGAMGWRLKPGDLEELERML